MTLSSVFLFTKYKEFDKHHHKHFEETKDKFKNGFHPRMAHQFMRRKIRRQLQINVIRTAVTTYLNLQFIPE